MRDMDGLIAFIEGRMAMPFTWGRSGNDCISYGVGWVHAQISVDLLEGSGLRWGSAVGAARVLKRLGGLKAAVGSRLPQIAPSMAQRGDLGLIRAEGPSALAGFTLVGVEGDTLIGPGMVGSERVSRAALLQAWTLDGVAR